MSLQPSVAEQELLLDTRRRDSVVMTPHERLAEWIVDCGFVVAVALLWLIEPPSSLDLGMVLLCTAVMVLATLVRFETPFGFTVATQLAFVPLVFVTPIALVPVAVVVALAIARLPAVVAGRLRPSRLAQVVGNAWFAIGPAAVFALAHTAPTAAGPALLIAALAAQFAVDIVVSGVRLRISRGAGFRAQLPDALGVCAIDAALSPAALAMAEAIHATPLAALAPVPLLGLLAVFARERRDRLRGLLELSQAYRGTALVLGDVVGADDGYTGEHSHGVVVLTLAVADQLGLGAEQRRNLEFGALLHDVGKIAIPKAIINKPGGLDPAEWTVVRTHTIEGQRMLDQIGGFMRDVGLIVRSHHERWDGSGYPDRLAGSSIPLESRIIACCDTWNAMRTDRSYRKALSFEAALAELRAIAGSQLDPEIVVELIEIVSRPQSTAGPGTNVGSAADASLWRPAGGLSVDADPSQTVAAQSERTNPNH
jgi:putative nucleotidyltransferase with HDIG domain